MEAKGFKVDRKIIYIILAVAVLGFMVGNKRFRTLVSRKIEIAKLRRELKGLEFEDAKLRRSIYLLENDDSYIEYLIRRDLGYLKQNEFEYRFRKEEPAQK